MKDKDWTKEVKGILKSELARQDMSYEELCEKLKSIGVEDKPENINNKINRGTFSAVFFLQCLKAIGSNELRV